MMKNRLWAMMLMAMFTIGAVCACGGDEKEDGGSQTGIGYGYAEMDGHKSTFKYAFLTQYEYENIIWFFPTTIQEMMNNPYGEYATFRLYLNSRTNKELSNLSIGSVTEGTITKGVGLEYSPYGDKEDGDLTCYISGMASDLEKTTVTITKTGTNRYRVVAKDQVYLVQEDGHGVWYTGNKPGVRTVVGNFEWEGPIEDGKTVFPEEYWEDDDD